MSRREQNMKHGKKSRFSVILIVLVILVLALGVATFYISGLGKPLAPGSEENYSIEIETGASTAGIGSLLEEQKIIGSAGQFKLWSKLKGYDGQYKAGSYTFSPAMSFAEIAEILVKGVTDAFNFTIPEGYTIEQVARKLESDGLADAEKLLALLRADTFDGEYAFLTEAPAGENHMEGYLMPNTYSLPKGAAEEDFIRVMLEQFQHDVYDGVFQDPESVGEDAKGRSMQEILTVASIIEREAAAAEERPLVASVIYNRLAAGMPLQMCSTVQYLLGEPKAVLSYADTQIESPYNTYLHAGLPPGPICSPGLASIKAALKPADTDYLYFVLSEKLDGTSNFSADYDQFLRDKAAYDKAYTEAHQ